MERAFYTQLADEAIQEKSFSTQIAHDILKSPDVEILPLLNAAYEVRQKYFGKKVSVHMINNAQNGKCAEDCHYCAQAKSSNAAIEEYPIKSTDEIMAEAKNAYERGAHRYCMVFAGRGPSQSRTKVLCDLVRQIKNKYPIEVCVSTGILDEAKAKELKEAGLDRLNHNLNASASFYPKICTTHTYQDRLQTLKVAHKQGLQLCSGLIVGMGEGIKDIIEVAVALKELKVASIPINFFMPIKGSQLSAPVALTPEYCLRVLCLFRLMHAKADIRVAAGREMHLRDMQVMALYAANSLFMDGYLNTKGTGVPRTLRLIQDAGFQIESKQDLTTILKKCESALVDNGFSTEMDMKGLHDLRPELTAKSSLLE